MSDVVLTPGAGNFGQQNRETAFHSHVGKKGDLTVELHYGSFGTGHKREAALFIWRGTTAGGVYVPLSMMWQYAEKNSMEVLIPPLVSQLYGFVTKDDLFRLQDAILDFMDDLRKSPPDPELFKDRSLDAWLEGMAREGLDFYLEMNGQRVIG